MAGMEVGAHPVFHLPQPCWELQVRALCHLQSLQSGEEGGISCLLCGPWVTPRTFLGREVLVRPSLCLGH